MVLAVDPGCSFNCAFLLERRRQRTVKCTLESALRLVRDWSLLSWSPIQVLLGSVALPPFV